MGLKSMHEASRPPREQESNLQLIEEQTRKISEQEQTISELLSQVSMLKSEMQKLADKNVKLNEADNVLKQNAELKKQNELLKQEAMTEVSSVKREYARKQAELERKIASAEYRERQASTLEADLSHQADTRAQELTENKLRALQGEYEAKKKSLDSEYKTLTVGYEGFLLGCLLYGVLVTLFTAVRSEAFISDFKTFFITIWQFIVWLVESFVSLGEWASQLGDMIPQPIVAFIVHWLLWILACIGLGIGIVILVLTGFFKWLKWFKENQADLVALSVFLVSLALIIFFAEVFKAFLPINLLLLLLLVQIVTMGIRAYK